MLSARNTNNFLFCSPVTDEILLVEYCPIGTEEGVGEEAALSVTESAEMEGLGVGKWEKIRNIDCFTHQPRF